MTTDIAPPPSPEQAPSPAPGTARHRWLIGRLVLWPVGLALLAFVVVLGVKLARGNTTLGEVQLKPYAAPDFAFSQFDGQRFSLADQRGKIVVVNFWASWCIPCKDEAPILEAAWQRYQPQGAVFVGVDIKDTEDDARSFLRRYAITYPNGFDADKRIYIDYGVYGLPETFVADRQGFVIHHVIGAITRPQIDGWLAGLAASDAADP